jgi:hypothetical protein
MYLFSDLLVQKNTLHSGYTSVYFSALLFILLLKPHDIVVMLFFLLSPVNLSPLMPSLVISYHLGM